jgi:hypothetical protein
VATKDRTGFTLYQGLYLIEKIEVSAAISPALTVVAVSMHLTPGRSAVLPQQRREEGQGWADMRATATDNTYTGKGGIRL